MYDVYAHSKPAQECRNSMELAIVSRGHAKKTDLEARGAGRRNARKNPRQYRRNARESARIWEHSPFNYE